MNIHHLPQGGLHRASICYIAIEVREIFVLEEIRGKGLPWRSVKKNDMSAFLHKAARRSLADIATASGNRNGTLG
jgi:hypothetical protein